MLDLRAALQTKNSKKSQKRICHYMQQLKLQMYDYKLHNVT